jgi:ATP-binding cassette subfamily F protein 3
MLCPVSVLSLRAAVKSFGSRLVLDGLDFDIEAEARVGVIGPNGSGKSTLLRLLAGIEEPDAGQAVRRRGLVVSLLAQHPLGDKRTPLETLRAARPDLQELEGELARCAERLGTPEVASDLDLMARVLRRQEELLERYEAAGGPSFEGRARAQLSQVGFGADVPEIPTSELSGGERKLVELAACLVRSPDVLLLDEPEAHLDTAGRNLLEELVASFPGAVVVVSHDRYLLDEMVSTIASLDRGRVRTWPGNYSAYALARELELRRQQVLYTTQQKEIERLEAAVRRFRDWAHRVVNERHARQARVKQRQIDSMDKVERPVLERRKIGLRLHPHERGGQRVSEFRGVTVAFGDQPVLNDVDLTVLHGERVGVVGANGAGKSVLLKMLVGELAPTGGDLWVGPSIRVGYLAQDQETLDPGASPLETVRAAHRAGEGEAVSLLMKFLFPYEQVRRPNRLLSGGERTRLQLLLLTLSGANLLVLDEPTNHLDIDSVEVLESALEGFAGTVVFTSHDRYFLDRIADRIVEVADGSVRSYEGGYTDWFERRGGAAHALTA